MHWQLHAAFQLHELSSNSPSSQKLPRLMFTHSQPTTRALVLSEGPEHQHSLLVTYRELGGEKGQFISTFGALAAGRTPQVILLWNHRIWMRISLPCATT